MIDMSTMLVRANFIDTEKQQVTIAVFRSYEEIEQSKAALFSRTVSLYFRATVSASIDFEHLNEETAQHLLDCFNSEYVIEDCLEEQKQAIECERENTIHSAFKECVFDHEFCASDLERHYFDEFRK